MLVRLLVLVLVLLQWQWQWWWWWEWLWLESVDADLAERDKALAAPHRHLNPTTSITTEG